MLERILVISQVYPPDSAAVGQHIADVAEALVARGHHVTVLTSDRGYDDPAVLFAARESRNGVDVRRLPFSSFGKRSLASRLVAQTLFMVQAITYGLLLPHLTRVLASTSPPFAGAGAALVARIRRRPLVWWIMDLNPDQLIATGSIRSDSWPARIFDAINRFCARTAAAVIVLDNYMKQRVTSKYQTRSDVSVIAPWSHEGLPSQETKPGSNFRRRHGLETSFVVMYSGNHALQHPLATVLDAADRLRDMPGVKFVFVGGGAGKSAVEAAIRRGLPNILSLPYQPLDQLGESLAAADIHVVTMGNDMVGIVHPCKIYGILAAGRPVLYFGPQDSPISSILDAAQCGWRVDHGDVDRACAVIMEVTHDRQGELPRIADRALRFSRQHFPHGAGVQAVCDRTLEAGCHTLSD